MKKILQTGNLYYIICFLFGLILVSCSLKPGKILTPAIPLSPTSVETSPPATKTQPGVPLMSMDLSVNQGNRQVLTALIWLPDGKFVLTGSGGISLYQLPKAGLQPQAAASFQSQITAENPTLLTSTPDGIDLAWITADRTVVYWDTTQAAAAANIGTSDSPITGLALNPNRKDLVYSTFNGEIYLWSSGSQSIIKKWKQNSWLSDLSYSPDGQFLAGVDPSNFTATVYTQDGQIVKQLEWTDAVNPSLFGAFFSPDWKKIAWVSQSAVQFMDVATGKNTVLLSHEDAVGAVAWASDSTLFATSSTITQGGDITAAVLVWDSNTGKLLRTYPQTSPVQSITFAPDGKSLAVLDVSGQLYVWGLDQ